MPNTEELSQILAGMDVPEARLDLTSTSNLYWLSRNLPIRNGDHPQIDRAKELIKLLLKTPQKYLIGKLQGAL